MRPNKEFTEDQISRLKQLYYGNVAILEIAKELKTSDRKIRWLLREKNLPPRERGICNRISSTKYFINHSFFDQIDREDKAYILGILYADGCNHESIHQVELSLIDKDKDILEKINKCLNHTKPLQFIKKRSTQHSNVYRVMMVSKNISNKLSLLGCCKKKTFKLKFPSLDENLIRHFIRGYFDGDGSLYINQKKKSSCIYIVSTNNFLKDLKQYLGDKLKINSQIDCRYPERKNNIRTLDIGGNKQVIKFLTWIYDKAQIFGSRKYSKYCQLKELCLTLKGCNYV